MRKKAEDIFGLSNTKKQVDNETTLGLFAKDKKGRPPSQDTIAERATVFLDNEHLYLHDGTKDKDARIRFSSRPVTDFVF
jgi:hypothetical protein